MNKILLALTILGVGAGGFLTARNLTTQLAHQANANHESWLVQTQQLAAFQREQADLAVRLRRLDGPPPGAPLPSAIPVCGLWRHAGCDA